MISFSISAFYSQFRVLLINYQSTLGIIVTEGIFVFFLDFSLWSYLNLLSPYSLLQTFLSKVLTSVSIILLSNSSSTILILKAYSVFLFYISLYSSNFLSVLFVQSAVVFFSDFEILFSHFSYLFSSVFKLLIFVYCSILNSHLRVSKLLVLLFSSIRF